jgi:hypothetical protein
MELPRSNSAQPVRSPPVTSIAHLARGGGVPGGVERERPHLQDTTQNQTKSGWIRVLDAIRLKGSSTAVANGSTVATPKQQKKHTQKSGELQKKKKRKAYILDQLSMRQFVIRTISDRYDSPLPPSLSLSLSLSHSPPFFILSFFSMFLSFPASFLQLPNNPFFKVS